ncbi:hypothetical protein BJY52DRAFT_1188847 [Lactarius psammicola]|nr:hypothetical protein BJY52DRAFT_1188847 [Lactarius psammicola]
MSSSLVAATVPRFAAFDSGHKSAATVVFIFALLSALVLSIVLLGVVWVVSVAAFKRTASENLSREVFFFRSQLGQYAFSLLLSKWVSSLGGLIAIKWVNEGGVATGPFCAAQGALNELGEFGSSFFVVTMGIHTFNTLVLRNRQPQWVGPVVTALGWLSALAVGIGPLTISSRVRGPLYNIGSLSCGFSKSAPVPHMLLFFLPVFLASLLSAIVYSLVFLILRGTITINGGLRFQLDPERRLRLRNQTFEEYQRFLPRLPITFVLAVFPSSIVQSMDMSGINVSSGSMAFSYILVYLDGIFDVLILFNVLRVLGLAVKSQNSIASSDLEKARSERGTVSRPTYDWKPQSTFTSPPQAQITRTAPPAHPPSTILQGPAPRPLTLGRPLFQPHKRTESSGSSARLLTPEPLSRSQSPSPSLDGSEISVATTVVQKPIVPASVLDAKLPPPPSAIRNHMETGPLPTAGLPQNSSIGLTPYSPPRHSRISSGLSPIPGSPSIPQSAAPFLEVTLHSPALARPPTIDSVGSVISMYFSRKSTESSDLPPFPAPAVPRDSSVGLSLSDYAPPARRVPAALSVGSSQAPTPREGIAPPPKAALSIGAVGSGYGRIRPSAANPDSPPTRSGSPDDSTDASHYSDTEAGTPPLVPQEPQPPPMLPVLLQPTQPLRFSRGATVNARPSTTSERRLLDPPRSSRTSLDRSMSRALPLPPSRPGGQRNPSGYSHAGSSRQGLSSSSLGGYR